LYFHYTNGTLSQIHLLIPIFLFMGVKFPDLDVISVFEHRKTLHSLTAVLIIGGGIYLLSSMYMGWGLQNVSYIMLWPAGMILHMVQDMATPSGCALLYPFSGKKFRYARVGGTSVSALIITLAIAIAALAIIDLFLVPINV